MRKRRVFYDDEEEEEDLEELGGRVRQRTTIAQVKES